MFITTMWRYFKQKLYFYNNNTVSSLWEVFFPLCGTSYTK